MIITKDIYENLKKESNPNVQRAVHSLQKYAKEKGLDLDGSWNFYIDTEIHKASTKPYAKDWFKMAFSLVLSLFAMIVCFILRALPLFFKVVINMGFDAILIYIMIWICKNLF